MRSPRFPRLSAKQLLALTLVFQIGWVTTPVYSLSRSAPEAVAARIESSEPLSQPRIEKAATSGLPISASTPPVSAQGQHFAYMANLGANIVSAVATTVRNLVATFAAGSAPRSAAITPAQQQCAPPPSGIVSWWPGDGNANDIQDGNNGTLQNGATFAPGVVGQAFSFDGINDFISVADNPNLRLTSFTLSAWVNTADTSLSRGIISKAQSSGNWHSYMLRTDNGGKLQLHVDNRAESRYAVWGTSSTLSINSWHHVAGTWQNITGTSTDAKIYIDGVEQEIALVGNSNYGPTFVPGYTTEPLYIGRQENSGVNPFFKGSIDEVDIYGRVLTPAEIQAVYNAGSAGKCKSPQQCTAPPANMVSWWPGDGNADDIQGGNNGTLQNGAAFAAGKVGQAFSLDGINDYVRVSDSPNLQLPGSGFAISLWFNTSGSPASSQILLSKGVSDANEEYSINLVENGLIYWDFGGLGGYVTTQPGIYTPNQWYHLAVLYDPSSTPYGKVYLNGVEQPLGAASNFPHIVNSGSDLYFGTQNAGQIYYGGRVPFKGLIDEVDIFNRPLSSSEIQSIYNAGSAGKCKTNPGGPASLTLNPTTVNGGQTSTATVTLSNPAPAGGAEVTLSSSDTSMATVPDSITIAEGATSATFTVTTNTVAANLTVIISASYGGGTRTATLTVTAPLADLQVSSVNAPSQAFADSAFDLSWTVVNSGQSRANGPWSDKVFLSTDNQLGNDTLLADFPYSQSLNPAQSAARTQVMSIPRSAVPADGQYFLIVSIDANTNVNESDENNNWRAVPITVNRIPFPDLIVEAIQAPDTAFFDQTITVQWTVRNVGNGSTDVSGWKDQVLLSRDRTLNEVVFQTDVFNVSYLNAGERYVASANVRIPRGLFGTYYIVVRTDSGNAVAEDVENNNTLDRPVNLQVPPVPDLQVTLVQGPEEAFPGEPMFVNWRVENRGNGNTPPEQGTWLDGIYLSQDQNFTNPRLIGSRRHEGGLTQGAGYTVNGFSVEVPRNIVGDWHVFVVADYQNSVYEFVSENNNGNLDSTRQIRVRATPPDLIVTSITAPDTGAAARQITVNWTVKNQGAFEANASWFDTVYLSPDDTPDPKTDKPLGTVSRGSNLEPGLSYNASATVALTACITGTYYVYVYTDSRDQLFEFDPSEDAERNNFSELKAVQITSNPPDLQVAGVVTGTSGNAGQPVAMSWTVVNRGIGPTVEGSWEDRVYLSLSPIFNLGTALLAGSFAHSGDLAPNETYTTTQNVTLPTTAQGTYYVFVLTNPSNAVEECGSGNNNVGGSTLTINVTNNQPDLTVVSVSAPGGALAGQGIAVQWSASNAGTAAAVQNQSWNDAVYISADANLDDRDARLGTVIKTGPLAVGAAYQAQAQVTIPIVAAGTYYFIVRADDGNFVFEAQREDNNTGYAVIQIDVPSVDLQVTDVGAPAQSFSGQEMPVSWTVVNANSMPTNVSQWTDYVILSRDQIYDPTDRVIGYKTRIGLLDAGGSYTATVNAIVPPGLSGPYYVFVRADFHNVVAETNEANNVGGPKGFMLQLPPPVDLTVTAINVPGSGSPGEVVTFRWTVQNIGPNTATGEWGDAVYLSQDGLWDIGDALVGRVDRGGPLGIGQTYEGELTTELPAVDPGQYYVIVRTDVRNNVREQDETNNTNASSAAMAVDVTELQLGVPRNSTLQTDQERYYKVNVPGSETLLFTLDGQNPLASNELYARQGAVPSRSAFDFLFSRPNESDQEIVVPDTLAGFYYSLARAAYVPPGSTNPVTIEAEIVPFSIRSVSPNRIGDNGQVTITIKGARFQPGATVKLMKEGTELTAAHVTVLDGATVKSRFFLTNASRGVYDVQITNPGGSMTTLSRALTIEATLPLISVVAADGSTSIRRGFPAVVQCALVNKSNVDVPYTYVGITVGRAVNLEILGPVGRLPIVPGLPTDQWVQLSTTMIRGSIETAFMIRDLEVDSSLPFAIRTGGLTDGVFTFRIDTQASTQNEAESAMSQWAEDLRQELITRPDIPLDPEEQAALIDPIQWRILMSDDLISMGLLDAPLVDEQRQGMAHLDALESPRPVTCNTLRSFCRLIRTIRIVCNRTPARPFCFQFRNFERVCEAALDICPLIECRNAMIWQAATIDGGGGSTTDTCVGVVGPTDPNDKIGPTGYGPLAFTGYQRHWPYTINFENIPTATAFAQRIRVVDQLDPNLDWRTFRLREIGFGNYRISVPENRAFFQSRVQLGEDLSNFLADISARLDIATGQVTWTLTAIDPQTGEQPTGALLGLLPPNDDTGRGQGYVTYTILPKAAAPTGTQIINRATIIFDTEEPIITNTVTNTLDADLPPSAVAQLPATSSPTFTLSWLGNDVANGSGIGSFDIWVSENDGPYQPYLTGTTETSAEFSGVPGATYRFYSIARDNAGNVEAAPSIPDAATTIGQGQPNPTPSLTSLNSTSTAAGGPQFTLTVNGTNFVTASALHWNNSPRPTAYVSSTQLVATISASDIASEGTANITVVNPSPGGGTSNALTFTITPAPTCAQDVSNGVTVSRGGFRLDRATGRFVQSVTLSNSGGAAVASTMSLVLDGLSSNATLLNKSGDTSCAPPLGSPYINIDTGDDGVFSPGESATIVLEFDNPTQSGITYSTRTLAGNLSR